MFSCRGTAKRTWTSFDEKQRKAIIVFCAVSLICENKSIVEDVNYMSDKFKILKSQWVNNVELHGGELLLRDFIIRSICPDIYGLYSKKLTLAFALIRCASKQNSHLLLIGDTAKAKSKLLSHASTIALCR